MVRHFKTTPSFIESGRCYITQPLDIANHLNYFCNKIDQLGSDMGQTDNSNTEYSIRNNIMAGKN